MLNLFLKIINDYLKFPSSLIRNHILLYLCGAFLFLAGGEICLQFHSEHFYAHL